MIGFFGVILVLPCQAYRTVLTSQVIQSTEPSIPKKPLADPILKNFHVSSTFDSLKYSGSNTFTMTATNLTIWSMHVLYPIQAYSLMAFVTVPYASILIAIVHFQR